MVDLQPEELQSHGPDIDSEIQFLEEVHQFPSCEHITDVSIRPLCSVENRPSKSSFERPISASKFV